MLVKELIEKLQKHNPELPVVCTNYNDDQMYEYDPETVEHRPPNTKNDYFTEEAVIISL